MSMGMIFFFEAVVSGLMAGVMYALVALGFVLIFKASGLVNFAQGVMALFAALALYDFIALDGWVNQLFGFTFPIWAGILLTVGVMIIVAWLIERLMLQHLVKQDPIILFMASIGLAYVLEGVGDILFGSDVKPLDIGIPQGAWDWAFEYGFYVEQLELFAALTAAVLVVVLGIFFHSTRIGRALRAVADDHQAALSIGINLRTIWVIVWSVAGVVALVAGIMWGSKSGIQFSLSLIALKALPVLILGGFTSVPGAIIGGLIIGVGEKLAELYIGTYIGGAIENWFAYMLALVFLFFRPQGLFGERIIERV
jgi:branched-chain amino acid transport system permease protein